MFKNIPFLFVTLLLVTNLSLAQKKEKIKGSKIVTVALKEINSFENIEVSDNFEILLVKGTQPSLEIEADDNLHDIINFEVSGNTLRVNALKDASGFKKFTVRINYSDNLKLIIARNETTIKALADLELENITIKNYDNSKSFVNVKSDYFSLILDDKSEAEINVKSENTTLELSKSSELKAFVASPEVKIDMYQKSDATIEGNTANAKIRLDNTSNLVAQKLVIGNLELNTENFSKCEVNVSSTIQITAAGKSQIELFGEPKITIEKFINNATLYKKEKK
jgi:hypothetical protein